MIRLNDHRDQFCPYRAWLKIDSQQNRLSWFELLGVEQHCTDDDVRCALQTRLKQLQTLPAGSDPLLVLEVRTSLQQGAQVLATAAGRHDYHRKMVFRRRFERIGDPHRGRHGTAVAECWDHTLQRRVAIRRLLTVNPNAAQRQQFLREAQFFSAARHPHLPVVHQVDEQLGVVVMEYCEYSVLEYAATLAGQSNRILLAEQMLRAGLQFLASLHEQDQIHGGLENRSFRVNAEGQIRVFQTPVISAENVVPIPDTRQTCQAPEMLTPDTFGQLGPASDLYMLGISVVELLVGGQLFTWIPAVGDSGKDDPQLCLKWHSSPLERLPALPDLIPEISPVLAEVLTRLCEKRCADRFTSAAEALSELDGGTSRQRQMANSFRTSPVHAETFPVHSAENPPAMPQQRGVRDVGGHAPLFHQRLPMKLRTMAWHEIIQDPALIWQCIRHSRPLQAALVIISIGLVLLFRTDHPGPSVQPVTSVNEPPVAAEEKPTRETLPEPPDLVTEIPTHPEPAFSLPNPAPSSNGMLIPVRFDHSEDLPAEDVLLDLPPRRPSRPPAPETETPAPFESVPFLQLVGVQNTDQQAELRVQLQELRKRPLLPSRRHRLYVDARRSAPEDPRVPFLYAATGGYAVNDLPELELAVRLSPSHYTQPFRKLTESRLRLSDADPTLPDRVLADVRIFCRQLAKLPDAHERLYEWHWAGRVLGWLESHQYTTPGLSEAARTAAVAISRNLPSVTQHEFAAGRSKAARSGDLGPLFPQLPESDVILALESFSAEERLLLGKSPVLERK